MVGYASLAMSAIDRATAAPELTKGAPDPVAALLLGRLAVDREFTGLGVGTALVAHVLATVLELNVSAACRAVVVTAINDEARRWWERVGFRSFDAEDPDQLDLYLLTAEIEATLRALG